MNALPLADIVQDDQTLRQCLWKRRMRSRLHRLLRNPWGITLRRLGIKTDRDWRGEFLAFSGWTRASQAQFQRLPASFFTDFTLAPDSAEWLGRLLHESPKGPILECGSGVSTIVIALALAECGLLQTRFVSLENDEGWLAQTALALRTLGLSDRVELRYAPLRKFEFDGREFLVYDRANLDIRGCRLLFVDGPPKEVGRTGVLPSLMDLLADSAMIVIDDASRTDEFAAVRYWESLELVRCLGFVCVGEGLAIMTAAGANGDSTRSAMCR